MARSRYTGDDGVVAVELVIIAPVILLGLMMLVVFAGRFAHAENSVQVAAQRSARAATLKDRPGTASEVARHTAEVNLAEAGVACSQGLDVAVNTAKLRPGGQVTVTVICTASFADVASLGVPGTRVFSSTSTEIVDTYRSNP